MAFLQPQFLYDAFVSYSHGDPDGHGESPLKDWTVQFVQALKTTIKSVDPEFRDLNIWFDKHIDPTRHLTDSLRSNIKSSGILMIIMSPPYLASSWCQDELEWFREQIADRATNQGRVFVVHVLPTNSAKWPAFLRDERGNTMVGFQFHEADGGMPFGWGWPDIHKSGPAFAQQLWRLQTALTVRLRELQAAAVPLAPIYSAAGGKLIYLHSRAQYANLRDTVRNRLTQDGLMPLSPANDTSNSLGDLAKESKERIAVAKGCAALALVRADDDESFLGDLLDIGFAERGRIQAARGGVPLPCAVLDGSGKNLPIDVTPYGISRFDLAQENWHGDFRAWVSTSQPQTAAE